MVAAAIQAVSSNIQQTQVNMHRSDLIAGK